MPDGDLERRLLEYLRSRLGQPALEYSEPPTSVGGGFDTRIFAFRLGGGPPAFAGPLILRLFGPLDHPARILREAVTQNAVADLGYPTARSLLAVTDLAPLGGGFLVMERLSGKPLMESGMLRMPQVLLDMQLQLHALDANVLLRALEREDLASMAAGGPALERETMMLGGYLAQLERRIARGGLDGLRAAMAWLVEHRPPEPARPVICHGDFHPGNILVSGTVVTGVLDWPNTLVADAAYDVASTLTILGRVPLELLAVSEAIRWLIRGLRPVMVRRYLTSYRRRRPLDPRALAYYEALSCMRQLVRTYENRRRAGAGPLNPLDASSFGEVLAARFSRLTGLSPGLPAAI
ncbi:MAG TPA: phosphotransferase [Candidatus Methylomirabilis sp.]|nr:phosphotransferase [Candidatus Methylomirabilis sp.]